MTSLSIFSVLGLLITSVGFLSSFIITFLVTRFRLGEIPPHKHDVTVFVIAVLSIIWVILCFYCVLDPAIISFLGLLSVLRHTWIEIIALLLCLSGLLILIAAFFEMDNSFRMGIPPEEEAPAALITTGIFKYIRNPGFLGVNLAVLGTFFLVPTIVFGILVVMSWISFHLQIKKEEAYLQRIHGDIYNRYVQQTGRYFPKLFK